MDSYFDRYSCAKLVIINCLIWENGFKTENVELCLSMNLSMIWTDSGKMF